MSITSIVFSFFHHPVSPCPRLHSSNPSFFLPLVVVHTSEELFFPSALQTSCELGEKNVSNLYVVGSSALRGTFRPINVLFLLVNMPVHVLHPKRQSYADFVDGPRPLERLQRPHSPEFHVRCARFLKLAVLVRSSLRSQPEPTRYATYR